MNYVLRTSELVVLDDAAQQGKFRADAYVISRRPKSVLCAPVAHKGKLIGVVYLENNQVAGAFTPGRLEALNILMSQSRRVDRERDALQRSRNSRRARSKPRTSRLPKRSRSANARRASSAATGITSRISSKSARASSRTRRAGSSTCRGAPAWPRSHRACLHNVGNVMNSVNVGASVARESVKALPVEGVARVVGLLDENAHRLSEYLVADPIGRKVPEYLRKLGAALADEKRAILGAASTSSPSISST